MKNNMPVDPAMIALIELTAASVMSQCRSRWTFTQTTAARKLVIMNDSLITLKSIITLSKHCKKAQMSARLLRKFSGVRWRTTGQW
jgi:hypothetical protein